MRNHPTPPQVKTDPFGQPPPWPIRRQIWRSQTGRDWEVKDKHLDIDLGHQNITTSKMNKSSIRYLEIKARSTSVFKIKAQKISWVQARSRSWHRPRSRGSRGSLGIARRSDRPVGTARGSQASCFPLSEPLLMAPEEKSSSAIFWGATEVKETP